MVAYFFIKGVDSGYGITSVVGSQEELVANGFLILMGLIDEIALGSFGLLFSYWKIYLICLLIGVIIILFEKFTNNRIPTNIERKSKRYLSYAGIVLAILYIFITCPLTAFEKGKSYAHEKINLINEKGCEIKFLFN